MLTSVEMHMSPTFSVAGWAQQSEEMKYMHMEHKGCARKLPKLRRWCVYGG
jgi:hypothetical protein